MYGHTALLVAMLFLNRQRHLSIDKSTVVLFPGVTDVRK